MNIMNLHTEILSGIMQNFSNVFPVPGNQHQTNNRDVSAASGTVSNFSETLAQRLSENESQDMAEIRRIINEEIVAAVGRQSTDFTVQLARRNHFGSNHLPSVFGQNGLNSLNLLTQGRIPLSAGTAAMMQFGNPLDVLQFYGSMLNL